MCDIVPMRALVFTGVIVVYRLDMCYYVYCARWEDDFSVKIDMRRLMVF